MTAIPKRKNTKIYEGIITIDFYATYIWNYYWKS